jgi:hypothetical protein
MTTWSPDTCDCVIEYSDDGNTTHLNTVRACAKHQKHGNSPAHLAAVLAHNRKKNYALNSMIEQGLDLQTSGVSLSYDPASPSDDEPVIVKGLKASDVAKFRKDVETKVGGAQHVRFD